MYFKFKQSIYFCTNACFKLFVMTLIHENVIKNLFEILNVCQNFKWHSIVCVLDSLNYDSKGKGLDKWQTN